ncbi:hypothetical protein [Sphingosinicella sp. BN140058]|uniref:hypothetical protein n=1 Tax=Sphingosinicella sp. BN140058 TaxID=1892855 RepID=UPI00101234BE|nr:hypothetical protein [Sphingosinicella sp. BN140058]QAY80397.1 hypothetical protein ETR14_27540 [Sphingosinicella sp. BN140058]
MTEQLNFEPDAALALAQSLVARLGSIDFAEAEPIKDGYPLDRHFALADRSVLSIDHDGGHHRYAVHGPCGNPLGLAIHEHFFSERAWHRGPESWVKALLDCLDTLGWNDLRRDHLRFTPPGFYAHFGPPDDADDRWQDAIAILAGLHARYHQSGIDIALRPDGNRSPLSISTRPGASPRIRGISPDLAAFVAALTMRPMLTWNESGSPQAIGARRRFGVPLMGFAQITKSSIRWKPTDPATPDAIDAGRSAAARHGLDFDRLLVTLEPPVILRPKPDVPVTSRIEWELDLGGARAYASLDADIQAALKPILRITDELVMDAPLFSKTKSGWSAPEGRVITGRQAEILLRANLLTAYDEWLSGSVFLHRLVMGLALAGYETWDGVETLAALEHVPQGVRFDPEMWGGHRIGIAVLSRERARFIRSDRHSPKRSRDYGEARRATGDYASAIAAIAYDDRLWPDHSRDGVAELEGRPSLPVDPSTDMRDLPGPLGLLYRAPKADRLLMHRYLRALWIEDNAPQDPYDWARP